MGKLNELIKTASVEVSKAAGRTGLKIKKKSPDILLGIGIVSFGVTLVCTYKAALDAQKILKEHEKMMDDISDAAKVAEENPEEFMYDEELQKADKLRVYVKTGVKVAKTFAPVVAFAGLSLACILTSRNILNNRYVNAVAAYNVVSETFKTYRSRVIAEQGEVMDRHFLYGTEIQEVEKTEIDENGKKKKVKEIVEVAGTEDPAMWAKWFDGDTSRYWDKDPQYSRLFLKGKENMFNDLLTSRGHVFLNEVYDELGIDHTQEGAVVGWIRDKDHNSRIDFGIFDRFAPAAQSKIWEGNRFFLTFNCDGIIYDKI